MSHASVCPRCGKELLHVRGVHISCMLARVWQVFRIPISSATLMFSIITVLWLMPWLYNPNMQPTIVALSPTFAASATLPTISNQSDVQITATHIDTDAGEPSVTPTAPNIFNTLEHKPTSVVSTPIPRSSHTPHPTVTRFIQPSQTNTPRRVATRVVATELPSCPGSPPVYIRVGETVVVDFNDGSSALRILTTPSGGANETIVQAYDNHRLEVIRGPECGRWQGSNVWYWYVRHVSSGRYGWAMEGRRGDRWLCNLDNPECG